MIKPIFKSHDNILHNSTRLYNTYLRVCMLYSLASYSSSWGATGPGMESRTPISCPYPFVTTAKLMRPLSIPECSQIYSNSRDTCCRPNTSHGLRMSHVGSPPGTLSTCSAKQAKKNNVPGSLSQNPSKVSETKTRCHCVRADLLSYTGHSVVTSKVATKVSYTGCDMLWQAAACQ